MYPIHSGTLSVSEYYHPIYQSLPLDHFKNPRHVCDVIQDSEQHSVTKSHNSYNNITVIVTLSVRTLRVRELCRHDRDTSRSITNSGTWMLILVPTYSTKIFIGRTVMTTYVIPFVIGMLLARDSIIGIIIPSSISLPESLFTRSVMHHPVTNSFGHIACKDYNDVHYREGPEIPLRQSE